MEITVLKKDETSNNEVSKVLDRKIVVGYARVSTDMEEQQTSYKGQKEHYQKIITKNSDWEFGGIYADEAISGTIDYKRTDFMRMINDGLNKKFDMIMTKSISRFARNTVDTLKYVRMLKNVGVAVFFEEENINTLEMSGELLLTILSSVAQQESETIASHVKLGFKIKSERGELFGFNNCYGYNYDSKNNKLNIVEEEAAIIKLIFRLYLEGHGGDYIANELNKMEVKTKREGKKWSGNTIIGMLKNEKYVGDAVQGKTITIDTISHKRIKNNGEGEKYYIKNHHEPIISRADFEKVQEILKQRRGRRATGIRLGGFSKKYTFSGKIKCGFCGTTYSRRAMYNKSGTIAIWDCTKNIAERKSSCPNSKAIRESLIENAFIDVYQIICNSKDFEIEELLKTIANSMRDESVTIKLNKCKKEKDNLNVKLKKLVDSMLEGIIDKEIYKSKSEEIQNQINDIENKIEQLELLIEDEDRIESGIKKLRKILETNNFLERFDSEVFEALVDYIIIGGISNGKIDNSMIRFICKTNFSETPRAEISCEKIINNVTVDSESSDYITLLDVYCNQGYYRVNIDENGNRTKDYVPKVRVRVEVEK